MNGQLNELYDFIGVLLDVGEKLLRSGAEVYRVEGTLSMMTKAYGAEKQSIFVITSNIVISVDMPGGIHATDTRRVLRAGGTNYACLEALNSISRRFCEKPFSVPELRKAVDGCCLSVRPVCTLVGSVLAAGAVTVFFGGSVFDGIFAAIVSLIICIFQIKAEKILSNKLQFNFVASLAVGLGVVILSKIFGFLHADKIIIGNIMLLIPGVAMTNSIRDIIVGDTISGSMRFIESLIWSAGLAVGIMLSLWIGGAL